MCHARTKGLPNALNLRFDADGVHENRYVCRKVQKCAKKRIRDATPLGLAI